MSKHIGTVGDKITIEATLVKMYEYIDHAFSYYGTTHYIYTMQDADANIFVWKTTSSMMIQLDEEGCRWHSVGKGDVISITGKIKEHGEYKGTKQTVLTRCKYELIKTAPTKEEVDEQERNTQLASLAEDDFIWEMPYKQYKKHYADCETVKGSYKFDEYEGSSIKVIIRAGRLKNSGVRGKHFFGYQFRTDEGKLICYRAVSEDNARRQMKKDFPNSTGWECTHIYRHALREFY